MMRPGKGVVMRLSRTMYWHACIGMAVGVAVVLMWGPAATAAEDSDRVAARGAAAERLAKTAIQGALSFLLQTRTTVGGFEFDRTNGVLRLKDVHIANPKGFAEGDAIAAAEVVVEAQPDLFRAEEPLINLIRLQGATVSFEQSLREGINLKKLMDNASRFQKERKQPAGDKGERKVLRIKKGVLDEFTLRVTTETLMRQTRTWRLNPIEMDFAGDGTADGITADKALSQALRRLLDEIQKSEAETETENVLPGVGELLNQLRQ